MIPIYSENTLTGFCRRPTEMYRMEDISMFWIFHEKRLWIAYTR